MADTREDKKNMVVDHFGAVQSYLHAIRLMAQTLDDQRAMCAIDLIADQASQAIEDAHSHANLQFAEPLPADEVLSVSKSAWKYKEAGRLMVTGGEATAACFQSDIDHLWDQPTALSLLMRLRLAHGYRNGGSFPLSSAFAASMKLSIPTFRAARDVLVDRFFIEILHPGGKGKNDPPIIRLI